MKDQTIRKLNAVVRDSFGYTDGWNVIDGNVVFTLRGDDTAVFALGLEATEHLSHNTICTWLQAYVRERALKDNA